MELTPRPLVLRPIRYRGIYDLLPDDAGEFDASQMRAARKAFTHRDGASHDVHPRLMAIVYRATLEFRAPYVWVISGYREGRSTSRTSRHTQGRAIDMVLPGVNNARLARFLRRQGFVGVGTYSKSGFVHLDVRERSFFWQDDSAPGEPSRERRVRRAEGRRYDRRARERGEQPTPDVEAQAEAAEAVRQAQVVAESAPGEDVAQAGADEDVAAVGAPPEVSDTEAVPEPD